tara:strand:+ start:6852 stop:7214 length:363 start_codon:yes stop_codon:yes gene_type:complete
MIKKQSSIPENLILSKNKRSFILAYNDKKYEYTSEYLRVNSPSAEVKGHSPEQRKIVSSKRSVLISNLELIGNYALRITFSDGHDTGIYSWSYLKELHSGYDKIWRKYISDLRKGGLSRD